MTFAPGWDRRDRWTLRFLDGELERSYQHADQAERIRGVRIASLAATLVWITIAVVGPSAVGAPTGPIWAICGFMVVFLIGCAAIGHWATTQRRRDALGMGQQLAAGMAALLPP